MVTERTEQAASRHISFLGLLLWALVRLLGRTLRIRYENRARLDDLVSAHRGAILALWHAHVLIPTYVLRDTGYVILVSRSRDGELLTQIMLRFGYRAVRGSTGRGGMRGALQAVRRIQEGEVVCVTPDGPRGPARKVQPGVLFLAQRSGCPIIPLSASARPRRLLRSWDRFLIPLPFARAAFVVGDPIFVPPDLDEGGKERMAEALERALNAGEQRAEEIIR